MDCQVCAVRSAVGYCIECRKLVCEECGSVCEKCGRTSCPEHATRTRHGHQLCQACMATHEEHKQARRRHHAPREDSSFAALAGDGAGAAPERGKDADEERPILRASAYQPAPLWRQSLYAGGLAMFVALVVLASPGLRAVAQPWASVAAWFGAGIAALFAGAGLVNKMTPPAEKRLDFLGLGIAILVAVLAWIAFRMERALY